MIEQPLNTDVQQWVETTWGDDSTITWEWIPGSFAGNAVWRVVKQSAMSEPVIVKYPLDDNKRDLLVREMVVLNSLRGFEGVAQVVASHENLGAVVMREVSGSSRAWTMKDGEKGLEVLAALHHSLPANGDVRTLWRPLKPEQQQRWERWNDGMQNLYPGLTALKETLERNQTEFILGLDEDIIPSHTDPHPGNWMLTDDNLVLLDFGSVCLAPRWYDEAVFLCLLPLPVEQRLQLADQWGVDRRMIELVVSLWSVSLVVGLHSEDPEDSWLEWARSNWPPMQKMMEVLLDEHMAESLDE